MCSKIDIAVVSEIVGKVDVPPLLDYNQAMDPFMEDSEAVEEFEELYTIQPHIDEEDLSDLEEDMLEDLEDEDEDLDF